VQHLFGASHLGARFFSYITNWWF